MITAVVLVLLVAAVLIALPAPERRLREGSRSRAGPGLSRLLRRPLQRPGTEIVAAGLPAACDLLAVVVSSGLPLRSAVHLVAPLVSGRLGAALGELDARVALGADESEAWRNLSGDTFADLGAEVARAVVQGTGLAEVLRRFAADSRQRVEAATQQRARRVGVRSVLPLMVCYLPAFVLTGIVPVVGGIAAGVLP